MGGFTDRSGERFITNEGYEIVIVEYKNATNLLVEFQDEYKAIIPSYYHKCKDGGIKNPYHPSVYGVGYLGQGKYKGTINGKQTKQYFSWFNILQRGYDNKLKTKYPTYKDAYVCEEWHNFQNFGEWFDNNYYEIEGETMCLDKDVLCKGNKEYAPDKCVFVPNRINVLITKNDAKRGDLPIGVHYKKENGKYMASCNINNEKRKFLGYYNTPEEAFKAYKEFKEEYIKQVADEYRDKIPQNLYEALYKYEVEITD